MNFFDILHLALRNLREARLRAGLTTMGVIIGVAVIVTMVSFGLGLQRNTVERFNSLDLFNEITVSGRNLSAFVMGQLDRQASDGGEGETAQEGGEKQDDAGKQGEEKKQGDEKNQGDDDERGGSEGGDEGNRGRGDGGRKKSSRRALDDKAIEEIARIPGVAYVEPSLNFTAYVRANGRVRQQLFGGARVPNSASRFRSFAAGGMISAPDAGEVVVDSAFLKSFGFKNAQEAVGQIIEILAPPKANGKGDTPEQKPGAGVQGRDGANARAKGAGGKSESTGDKSEGTGDKTVGADEDEEPLSFFGLPLEESGAGGSESSESSSAGDGLEARPFRIAGVLKDEIEGAPSDRTRFRGLMPVANVYAPLPFAREWSGTQLGTLEQVAVALARQNGMIKDEDVSGYEAATVRVENPVLVKGVMKRLDEMGFSSFSILSELDQIRTFFLVINATLGLLGSISLLVASFGIANTMIMSILERTREIGVMKAIGAEDREIKLIFFVEAAVIGLVGGVLGALVAWGIDKLANRIVYEFILKPQGNPFIDFFSLPPYLWLGAIAFAICVAVLAALYPAARAARIDPVRALRHD